MPNTWSNGREGRRSGELALLDRFVAAALAEGTDDREDAPAQAAETIAVRDPAEAFLEQAVGFLNTRPDRAAILERLRDATAAADRPPADPPAAREDAG